MQKERWQKNIEWVKKLKLNNQHLYLLDGIGHTPRGIFKRLSQEKIDVKKI